MLSGKPTSKNPYSSNKRTLRPRNHQKQTKTKTKALKPKNPSLGII